MTAKKSAKKLQLTPKEEAFCQSYLRCGVGITAYREAYSTKGNDNTAYVNASRLLDKSKIALRIKQLQERAAIRSEISVGRVLREYAKLAFLDIRKAFTESGELKPIHEMDDATAAAIAGLEFEEITKPSVVGRLAKIKLSDKKAALDALAKHLGMSAPKSQDDAEAGQVTWEEFVSIYRRRTDAAASAPVE